ncbi:MAG: hypothetical protein ACOYJJ_01460 [Anaerovoracaceae bacterium]|jgi:hypothetical protein
MPLLFLLGLIFVVGLFIYYMVSTREDHGEDPEDRDRDQDSFEDEGVEEEDNVIYLPPDINKLKEDRKNKK